MRTGIISLYYRNYNCGGLLQAFSLCKVLMSLGIDAEQICINEKSFYVNEEKLYEKVFRRIKDDGFFFIIFYCKE